MSAIPWQKPGSQGKAMEKKPGVFSFTGCSLLSGQLI